MDPSEFKCMQLKEKHHEHIRMCLFVVVWFLCGFLFSSLSREHLDCLLGKISIIFCVFIFFFTN